MEAAREWTAHLLPMAARSRLLARVRSLSSRWPWLRHWEFWLSLAIGAFLRLWQLGSSQFLDDQTILMSMARESVLRHAIPVTGIPSSIGALNPPLSLYLLIPFALFGKDPSPAIVGIALWNAFGVALCYVFAWRFFGRRVAAISTLLFATSGAAVVFSRFLWQQNYLPPLLIFWALATFTGAVRGSKGWFFASVVLLVLAVMLHPTALLFLPTTLAAFVLAPRKPRLWEYLAAAAALLVLAAPTLVWEKISDLSDLHILQQYTAAAPQINLDVLGLMEQVLGPPTFPATSGLATSAPTTASSPFAAVAWWAPALWYLACAVYAVSYIIVTGLVIAPAVSHWREVSTAPNEDRRMWLRIMEVARALHADTAWCIYLLLWLSVTIVPVALIRHSSPVHAHYLHVLYPLIFILAGVGVDRLLRWIGAGGRVLPHRAGAAHTAAARLTVRALIIGCIGVLLVGQGLQSTLYIASQAVGQVDNTAYGYPVGDLHTADAALDALQRQQGATATYISAPVYLSHNALAYMLVSEHPGRALVYGSCLVLPPAGSSPVLVVSTNAESPMGGLLSQMPNARLVSTLPMPGNEPFLVYRVRGDTPQLSGERMLLGLIFQDGFGNTMRLDGAATAGSNTLRLRWTLLHMASPAGAPRHFYVDARAVRSGAGTGSAIAHAECDPTTWQNGATIFTWVSTAAVTPPAQPVQPLPSTIALSAWDQIASYAAPTRHGFRFLTSDLVYQSPAQLVAMGLQHMTLPPGLSITRGELVASRTALSSP